MRELVVWATYGAVALIAWFVGTYVYRVEKQYRADKKAVQLATETKPEVSRALPRRGADGRFLPKSHA